MRSIELVGADSSRGSIIIWQTGSDVNWRRTGGEDSEMKGIKRAKGNENRSEQHHGTRIVHTHSIKKKTRLIYAKFRKIFDAS